MLEALDAANIPSSVQFKCEICSFQAKTEKTLSKHMKSKHPGKSQVSNNTTSTIDESEDTLEGDDLEQWFQTEVIDSDTVNVCNLCDEGFYSSDDIQKHMNDIHKDEIRSLLT